MKFKDLEFKYFLNKRWLKIFHHNASGGIYFDTVEEALYTNKPQKFSIIGLITPEFKNNDYYEFLLEYPEVEGYNNWKQKLFPRDVSESLNMNSGYTCDESQGCACSWTGKYWKGLSRSSKTSDALLDGSFTEDHWWFAIGATNGYANEISFPGPAGGTAGDFKPVYEVILWIYCSGQIYHNLLDQCNSPKMNFTLRMRIFTFIFSSFHE